MLQKFVRFWRAQLSSWREDRVLIGIVKNSSYLFSSNSIAIVLSLLQGIFAARLLGALEFGVLAGTIIPFVSNINRLFSFRMSELVVRYLGEFHTHRDTHQAAAVIKGAAMMEIATAVLAYLILILSAPLAARYLAKDLQTTSLYWIYGLVLLANMTYETAMGVLQVGRQFNRLAQINLGQSVITASMIFGAYLIQGKMLHVLLAYLCGKAFASLAVSVLAVIQLNKDLGVGWWRTPLNVVPDWRKVGLFALSTNLQGTVNLFVRDSETLLISALRSPIESGYFKIALGVINLVMMPIEPFIATTYPEITRTIVQRSWQQTRKLLKRVSALSALWTVSIGLGLAIFGSWLIPWMYGAEYAPSYAALLVLLLGYGFANILNWNRPLLLALGMPGYPLKISALVGLVKTMMTFLVVSTLGYVAEAAVLSLYFIASISIVTWRGLSEIRQRARLHPDSV